MTTHWNQPGIHDVTTFTIRRVRTLSAGHREGVDPFDCVEICFGPGCDMAVYAKGGTLAQIIEAGARQFLETRGYDVTRREATEQEDMT